VAFMKHCCMSPLLTRACIPVQDTPSPASRAAGPRPTLLILDRSDDVATSIMHSSTYQSLLADTLQYESNRVKVSEGGATKSRANSA